MSGQESYVDKATNAAKSAGQSASDTLGSAKDTVTGKVSCHIDLPAETRIL